MRVSISIFIVFIVLSILGSIAYIRSKTDITITVTDKERITKTVEGNDASYYLVYTDTETFANSDSMLFFKWNSSDVQGQLKVNQTYKVTVAGWRIPFLSEYRNIIKVQDILVEM